MASFKLAVLLGAALTACAYAQQCPVSVGACQVEEDGKTMIIVKVDKTTCNSYAGCFWSDKVKKCLSDQTIDCLAVEMGEIVIIEDENACENHTDCCWDSGRCLSDSDGTDRCKPRSCPTPPRDLPVRGCEATEDGITVIIDTDNQTICESYIDCCWNDGIEKCLNKLVKNDVKDGRTFGEPSSASGEERYLGLQPPPICTVVPKPFPADCKYSNPQPYVLDPPLEIPYCVRIPCSLDREEQKTLDKSQFDCGTKPGCYFDKELYEFRKDFGPAVLAGVPVCHLAIRNAVFHREAQNAIAAAGSWNPYYTKCLLDTFVEIREPPEGCKLISILKIFKILPKLAGWDGITSYECILIDGCWSNTEGCLYPVDVDNIVVKSNQRFKFNKFEVIYGRPKCQHFNDDNAYEVLKSYHQCLAAGCSVDANVAEKYYDYLFEIGNQMTEKDHWEYWTQVQRGKIGSNNIQKGIYWNFDHSFEKGGRSSIQEPPKPDTVGTPTGPFVSPGGGTSGGSLPSTQPLENTRCGHAHRQQGYRPCPPKAAPTYIPSDWCPYKPFRVPRFKPLRGSFRGCCDINPCYLSRRDIRRMHSGPSIYYTEWTPFSFCSNTCGPGIQKRSRQCVTHDQSLCTELAEETRPCFDKPCGTWEDWGPWRPACERKNQLQTKSRACGPTGAVCGPNQEKTEEETRFCLLSVE